MKISFYAASTGGTPIATDCGTTGTPVGRKVVFTGGVGSVLIGETTADSSHNCTDSSAPNAISATLFDNTALFLGITIEADAEMTPRKRVVATGYSLNADKLDDLETSAVGGSVAFVPVTDSSGNFTLTRNVTVDTDAFFVDATNNRVGVGTATPEASFEVRAAGSGSFGGSPAEMVITTPSSAAYSLIFRNATAGLSHFTGFYVDDGFFPGTLYLANEFGATVQTWDNLTQRTTIGLGTWSTLAVRPGADQANIGGTTTANASTTITGVGTFFFRDLGIGDRISLSSAPATYATVTAISSSTSLTVSAPLGNGTSQTINRKNGIMRLENSAGGPVMMVSDLGNIGLGVTAPAAFKLQVAGHVGPDADDTYDLGDNTHRWRDLYTGPGTIHIGTSTSDEGTLTYDTSTNKLQIDSTGTVDIGGGSGSSGCTVDASGNLACSGTVAGGGGAAGAFVNDGNSFGTAAILGTNDSNTLSFETAGATKMTVGRSTDDIIAITGGTLTTGKNALRVTTALPNDTTGGIGISFSTSSSGSGSAGVVGFDSSLVAGGTPTRSVAMGGQTPVLGTGTAPFSSTADANFGSFTTAFGAGAGTNVGSLGRAFGSTGKNYGVIGYTDANSSTLSIGTTGFTYGAGTTKVGGWFGLNSVRTTEPVPTVSSALIADNGNIATNIFLARDDGTTVFTIADGGTTTLSGNFLPGADDTHDLGSNVLRWRDLYLGPATLHIGTSTADEGTITYNTGTNALQIDTVAGGTVEISGGSGSSGCSVDASGNFACSGTVAGGGGAAGAFVNGGNSFGGAATLGTNDNFDLNLETNGSTKMTVAAAGNVGIGTASPTLAKLQINSTAGTGLRVDTSNETAIHATSFETSGVAYHLEASGIQTGIGLLLDGGAGALTSGQVAQIRHNAFYNSTATVSGNVLQVFRQNIANTGATLTTSGPLLHIYEDNQVSGGSLTSTNDMIRIAEHDATTGVTLHVTSAGTGPILRVEDDDEVFGNDASPFVIDATGNVGIGYASPSQKLAVNGSLTIANSASYNIKNSGGTDASILFLDGSNNLQVNGPSAHILFTISGAEKMRVDSSGNVGIGTGATPGALLELKDESSVKLLLSGAALHQAMINFQGVSGNTDYKVGKISSTDFAIYQGAGNTDVFHINSSGNIGISDSDPANFKLEVGGSVGPGTDNTHDLGSASLRWKTLHVGPGSVVVHNDTTDTNKITMSFSATVPKIHAVSTASLELSSSNGTVALAASNNLSIPSGNLNMGGSTTLTSARVLQNITGYAQSSGTFDFASAVTTSLANVANAWNFDSNTLSIDALNNRVGIGTAAPGQLLELVGGENSSIDLKTGGLTLRSSVNTVAGAGFGTVSSHKLSFFTGNTDRLTILADGNIGIGTSSPITQLHVPGKVPTGAAGSVSVNSPSNVYVQGRFAYVTENDTDTLKVYDVSNATPVQVGSVATGTDAFGVYAQGRYVYVTNYGSNSLQIFDVSNPASPTLVSTTTTGSNPYSLYVQGKIVFVVNQVSGTLQSIDVSNPSSPTILSSFSLSGGTPTDIYVQGRYAYITRQSSATLTIVDVSNPASPSTVGSVSTGASTSPWGVHVQGRYAYVALAGTNSFQIVDVSNPASPALVSGGTVATSSPRWLYVQGRYAYVTNFGNGTLQVIDVSNPGAPTSVGTVATGSQAVDVFVQGRFAYVVDYTGNTFKSFDFGGSYIQQLEAGGIETASLTVRNNLQALDADIRGGLTVGQHLNVSGRLGLQTGELAIGDMQRVTPIYIRGTGLTNDAPRVLIIGDNTVYNTATGIGLTLTIINKTDHSVVSTTTYDTFNTTTPSDNLATALNGITKTQIGILTSYDAWEGSISANLRAAFKRVGLTKAALAIADPGTSSTWRKPYVAIFEAATGSAVNTAKAVEVMINNDANSPHAEIRGWLIDGAFSTTAPTISNSLYNLKGDVISAISDDTGKIGISSFAGATATTVCYDTTTISGFNTFATCSSSLRYKEDIKPLKVELDKVLALQPVDFKWKNRDERSVGFIAEDVEKLIPEVITYNREGQIEGIEYKLLTPYIIEILKKHNDDLAKAPKMGEEGNLALKGNLSQFFDSAESLEPGEIVMVDSTTGKMKRAADDDAQLLAGVVAANTAGAAVEGSYPIALQGKVLTRIVGKVAIGDPITMSLTPGVGVVAEEPTNIIGIALDAHPDLGPGMVSVFIRSGWWNGSATANTEVSDVPPAALAGALTADLDVAGYSIRQVGRISGINDLWSIDAEGNFQTRGLMSTEMPTDSGPVKAYASQALDPEIVISGSSNLESGQAVIAFEQDARNIISGGTPLRVTVSLTSDEPTGIYIAEKGVQGFTVKQSGGGTSNASFDWIVVARRRGFDDPPPPVVETVEPEHVPASEEAGTDVDDSSAQPVDNPLPEDGPTVPEEPTEPPPEEVSTEPAPENP